MVPKQVQPGDGFNPHPKSNNGTEGNRTNPKKISNNKESKESNCKQLRRTSNLSCRKTCQVLEFGNRTSELVPCAPQRGCWKHCMGTQLASERRAGGWRTQGKLGEAATENSERPHLKQQRHPHNSSQLHNIFAATSEKSCSNSIARRNRSEIRSICAYTLAKHTGANF